MCLLLSGVPNQWPLAPNTTSVILSGNMDDNEVKPEAVQIVPGICLATEESPGALQLGECAKNHCVPYLQVVGLGGLGVMCSPRDLRFVGLNLAEVGGYFQDVKIPEGL